MAANDQNPLEYSGPQPPKPVQWNRWITITIVVCALIAETQVIRWMFR